TGAARGAGAGVPEPAVGLAVHGGAAGKQTRGRGRHSLETEGYSMKLKVGLLAIVAVTLLASCRDAGEWMSFTGSPEGNDGWGETYEASPSDVWEAFRLVARDNGTITEEDPDEMSLRGEYKPHDSSEW